MYFRQVHSGTVWIQDRRLRFEFNTRNSEQKELHSKSPTSFLSLRIQPTPLTEKKTMNGHHLNSHLQPSLQPLEMSSDIEFGIPSPLVQLFEKAQQLFPMNQTAIGSIPILPVQDMELMSSHSAGTPELDSRGTSPESSNGFYHESPVLEFKNVS